MSLELMHVFVGDSVASSVFETERLVSTFDTYLLFVVDLALTASADEVYDIIKEITPY